LLREQLTAAFHALSDEQSRSAYDSAIGLRRSPDGAVAEDEDPSTGEPAVPEYLSNKNKPRGDSGAGKRRGLFGLFDRHERTDARDTRPHRGATPPPIAEEAARGERLLQLRPFGAEVLAGSMRRPPAPERPPLAALSVIGPLGEERVPLPPRTITIGSSDENDIVLPGRGVAREQARMWPHGDSFALRVTGRGPVRVSGVEPSLAVVLLEDGDQIDMSEYRLTFHNAPRE
jgi:hypothetical protein